MGMAGNDRWLHRRVVPMVRDLAGAIAEIHIE
jgi:hypothetical protein